ncbi:MAG: prephenate dehydrogenase/arogenate dehydrogenase family protein [Candidatus Omnitrophota bacterium]
MRLFKKVAIVGTGLIGGSIALAIRKKRLADEVVGVSRRRKSIRDAKKKGAIDRGSQDLKIIRGCDVLILAMPVETIIKIAPVLSRLISRDCLVTDVGSTKAEIVRILSKIFPNFIGGHPLAGSEKTGILQAREDLFENSLCILTPTVAASSSALSRIKALWQKLGAQTVLLTPKSHDKILSFASHLPHVAAFALMGAVPKDYLRFAASGLKDTTRIARSEAELWVQIFLSNTKNLVKAIESFEAQLSQIKGALRRKDRKRLKVILGEARGKREKLEKSKI